MQQEATKIVFRPDGAVRDWTLIVSEIEEKPSVLGPPKVGGTAIRRDGTGTTRYFVPKSQVVATVPMLFNERHGEYEEVE